MLINKRMLIVGSIMIVSGLSLSAYINATTPVATSQTTDEEAVELLLTQRQNQDANTLAFILAGIGLLLVIISFGASKPARKSKDKTVKKAAGET